MYNNLKRRIINILLNFFSFSSLQEKTAPFFPDSNIKNFLRKTFNLFKYDPTSIYYTLISIQGGLMNAVTPQLRAVTVDFDYPTNMFLLFFFYDGEISDHRLELAYLADTDTDCLYYLNTCQVIQLDFPKPLPSRGKFAYLRKEPNLPVLKKENHAFLLKTARPVSVFALDMQQALLGKVTPALRNVIVGIDINKKKLEVYFAYDGVISEEDWNLANAAAKEAPISFPDYALQLFIKRVDYPKDISEESPFSCTERMGVYWRHERDW